MKINKRGLAAITGLLLLGGLMSGCSLAVTVTGGEPVVADRFCGYVFHYGRNQPVREERIIDSEDTHEQALYVYTLEDEGNMCTYNKLGSAVADSKLNVHVTDERESQEITGTVMLMKSKANETLTGSSASTQILMDTEDAPNFLAMVEAGEIPKGGTVAVCYPDQNREKAKQNVTKAEAEAGISIIPLEEAPGRLYAGKIYQKADGTLYESASGSAYMDPVDGSGLSVSESSSTTVNGITKGYEVTCGFTLKMVDQLTSVRVLEMDQNHQVLRKENFLKESLPETYQAGKDAAYLLVEEMYRTLDDKIEVKRAMYEEDAQHICPFPGDGGFAENKAFNICF